ncbi:MAG: hypothetical protein WAO56_07555 [Miniphocaeibacter sp.]|uniref:hypothetical protein n=1 Tax=Miniphocaeibacter sp. TaxID=3100973 RepID=UPI0017E3A233|nr:hypothetical protein [Gallicola sp.]
MKERTFKQLIIIICSLIMVCFMYFILFKSSKGEDSFAKNLIEQEAKEDKKLSDTYLNHF